MRSWRFLPSCSAALLLAASLHAAATPVEVRDDRGRLHRFAQPVRRIVSLLPSITESVCALGGCDRLVGVDRYSNFPQQVQALPRLGGLDDAPLERIVALKPDVVLVTASSRSTGRLEALGVQVMYFESATHADVSRSLASIAGLLGTPEAAARVEAGIERDLSTAAGRVPAAYRGKRVYFEIGSAPYAAGAASFIGQTLARIGLANLVPPTMGPFPKLNPEFVIRGQPDIVMASQHDLLDMAQRPGWSHLQAIAQARVCGFAPATYELLIRPGPRLGEAALAVADCLAGLPAKP